MKTNNELRIANGECVSSRGVDHCPVCIDCCEAAHWKREVHEVIEGANPLIINGKQYPLWEQFILGKEQWIGGVLQDTGDSIDRHLGFNGFVTEITEIQLRPNGENSAFFQVVGKDFTCGFDVSHGGIGPGEEGWITFRGYGGHIWRIKPKGGDVNSIKTL